MSSDRELTRIVRSWLDEGVNALPDRVLDDVLAQLPVTSQRRPWWRAWRQHLMSSTFKFAVAAAVALVVAVGGLGIYFSRPAVVPAASPTPLQSPAVTIATPTQPVVNPPTDIPTTSATLGPGSDAPFVVFVLSDNNHRTPDDLWAMRANGTDAQELLADTEASSVAWSQDGRQLLVVGGDPGGTQHIYLAHVADVIGPLVDTGFGTGDGTACLEKSGRRASCQSMAFNLSPDGQRAVFVQTCTYVLPGCGFLTILDLTTGELTELTETLEIGGMTLPAWSPDGTQIVGVVEDDWGEPGTPDAIPESHLYLIDPDGQNLHRLDLDVQRVMGPRWSPDGELIVFMSDNVPAEAPFEQNVYTVRPDGSDLRQLTTDGSSSWPEWLGNGQIMFRAQTEGQTSTDLWVMDADGSNATPLVDLDPLFNAIDPPREALKNFGGPGDPGRTFFWQPSH